MMNYSVFFWILRTLKKQSYDFRAGPGFISSCRKPLFALELTINQPSGASASLLDSFVFTCQ